MIRASKFALPLALLLLGAGPSQNPYLVAGVRLYQNLQFEAAIDQLQKAEAHSQGLADDVAIHTYRGLILLELNKPDAAETEFNVALSLDIDAQLPPDVSPKVKQKWLAVRREVLRTRVPLATPDAGAPDSGATAAAQLAPNPDAGSAAPVAGAIYDPPHPSTSPAWYVGVAGGGLAVVGGGLLGVGEAQGNAAKSAHYNLDGANQLHNARVEAGVGAALLGAGVVTVAVAVVVALSR